MKFLLCAVLLLEMALLACSDSSPPAERAAEEGVALEQAAATPEAPAEAGGAEEEPSATTDASDSPVEPGAPDAEGTQPEAPPAATSPAPSEQQPKPPATHPSPSPPPPVPAPEPAPEASATAPSPSDFEFATLEKRLRKTKALGFFTKLELKNQIDELMSQVRKYHRQEAQDLTKIRDEFDLLVMKVMTLLQDEDAELAAEISKARGELWAILASAERFAELEAT